MAFQVPERYRITAGELGSNSSYGNNGAFVVPTFDGKKKLFVIASDGMGWEHVSVSSKGRTPTWEEMHYIKGMFWDKEDTVFQFHPPQSQYVDCCKSCLHLWRNPNHKIELPPSTLVGPNM